MGKWPKRTLIAAVVAAAAYAASNRLLAPRPLEVQVVAVERGRVEATVTNSQAGAVEAALRAQLSPETSGRVVEIRFREGERVRRGELLLRLDGASQRAQLELAQRAVDAAAARSERACILADHALRELERNRSLAEERIVARDLLDRFESGHAAAVADCKLAAAELSKAEASVLVAAAELDKTVVTAPFDGVVAELQVEVGEWVTPSPPLLRAPAAVDLLDPSSLHIHAPMDETDAALLHAGQEARITVDSHPGVSFAGRVRRIAPYVLDVERQNRTVAVEVEFTAPAAAERLLPGTSADLELILEARDDALRIPAAALYQPDQVLVVEDGKLAARSVRLGLRNWNYCEVLAGLTAGELVVADFGDEQVRPGVAARPRSSAPVP